MAQGAKIGKARYAGALRIIAVEQAEARRASGNGEFPVVRGKKEVRLRGACHERAREMNRVECTEQGGERLLGALENGPFEGHQREAVELLEDRRTTLRRLLIREIQPESRAIDSA